MPPPAQPRACDVRIWLTTVLFLTCVLVGGGVLVMYVRLPESPATDWCPLVGMVLVGIPWLFWLVTFLYRVLCKGRVGGAPEGGPNCRKTAAGVVGGDGNDVAITIGDECRSETPLNRDNQAGLGATVLDPVEGGESQDSSEKKGQCRRGAGDSVKTRSSRASRESEVPLASAISS